MKSIFEFGRRGAGGQAKLCTVGSLGISPTVYLLPGQKIVKCEVEKYQGPTMTVLIPHTSLD